MPFKHLHLTVIPEDPNYDVSADQWNADHVLSGGTNGDVLVRNTGASSGWSLIPSAAGVFSCTAPGALPSFGAIAGVTITPNQGGTGITSYAIGDLIVATGATTLAPLSDVAVGSVLASGGVGALPTWTTSPNMSGIPTAATAVVGTNTAQLATTAFVIANMASAGAGNVVGAASSTDNAVTLFSGTTGRILKNSTVTVTEEAPTGQYPLGQTNVTIGSNKNPATIGTVRLTQTPSIYYRDTLNTVNKLGIFFSDGFISIGTHLAPANAGFDIGLPGTSAQWRYVFCQSVICESDGTGNGSYSLEGLAVATSTIPAAPAARHGRLFFDADPAFPNKMRLKVIFPTGAPITIATEP